MNSVIDTKCASLEDLKDQVGDRLLWKKIIQVVAKSQHKFDGKWLKSVKSMQTNSGSLLISILHVNWGQWKMIEWDFIYAFATNFLCAQQVFLSFSIPVLPFGKQR